MKTIGFKTSYPIEHNESFIEFETKTPTPTGRDLLVKIEAISVNPVDYKIRENSAKGKILNTPKIIGWDAVGTIEAVGDKTELFNVGDTVFYAGDITRPGTNAEYQLVDERIVGKRPTNISLEEAAAMPLTSLTAWEILFDRIRISSEKDKGKSILIIGGAGGVGSIAIQLAKKVAGLNVIATASRPETIEWSKKMGADYVVNHYDLVNEVHKAGFKEVDFILDFVDVDLYWDAFVELIKPQGRIGSISDPAKPVNLKQLKSKSVSFHWELMFTRSMFNTYDMIEQHHIFNTLADLLDDGTIQSTLTTTLNGFSVENLKKAHTYQETGKAIGKTVIKF
ncbi:zinc-binding alcohol dehydrogenase family protein [Aureibaculum sp. 2210JD6-5]|uniref:zinc-binding alcohol dehydrogenase family protein n=1 Tax=Aureibaculum sp. 2210JD6-5 TaxID=3103957 RepID=UPI002AACB4B1|nr:zinc-binding alcohol dehydrogenase family protein [Aureibaculum sp. 2210JD6-5]MDY7396087.1 zinc-binding alcohol dehydrogenase family protein [Aureibaculum sp. 2210JD6-5]